MKIIAQSQSYPLLVKYSKDIFLMKSKSFLMMAPSFLNTNLVFNQRTRLLPRENMDNGELNRVVFIDMHEAFDSINKFKVQFGITNVELHRCSSYLTNRKQVSMGLHLHPKRLFVASHRAQSWAPCCNSDPRNIISKL